MTDFAYTKSLFHLPEGIVYLDGNSLGPLPKAAMMRIAQTTQAEWGDMLIGGWNKAGWMDMPGRLGDRIGKLIGAPAGTVVLGDTLSVKIYQALASALELRPDRKVILSDTGNFPTDLYMAEGLIRTLRRDHVLKTVSPDALESALDSSVAVLLVTEVDYRTGRKHDMARLIAKAHDAGAVVIWDLAHSAGALPVDVTVAKADFAAGCTYKYLNGGPGAPAFFYVRPDHIGQIQPALSGWLGHHAPFAFDPNYKPGHGIGRMRIGTPPILQMAALDAALDMWDMVDLHTLRQRSIELSELFIAECERRCSELMLASPRDPEQRGSQVSFHFQHGYAAIQALIDHGVIGDLRTPDIMRFGITPLYIDEADIMKAAEIMESVMKGKLWELPKYQKRLQVT
jgi:kynureninase